MRVHQAGKPVGLALLTVLTFAVSGCGERPFTRDDAMATPGSAIQVGEYRDRTWEYVDGAGLTQELDRCEDVSPWHTGYRCTAPDGSVELTFNLGKRGMSKPTLHVGDEDVPLYCINDGFWGDGRRFCLPKTDLAVPTNRRDASQAPSVSRDAPRVAPPASAEEKL